MPQPKQELLYLPNGELLRPADDKGRELALSYGAVPASHEQERTEALKQQYSSWLFAPEAAALGVAQGAFPGSTSAVIGGLKGLDALFGTDQAAQTQDFISGVTAAHPDMDFYGQMAGALGTGGALSGMGAAKVAGMASLAGAAISADQLALSHAQTPEGNEKLLAMLGTGALVGLVSFGAGTGLAKAVSPVLQGAASKLAAKGEDMYMGATLPAGAREWLESKASLAKAQSYLVDNDLLGKSQPEIIAHLTEAENRTAATLQEAYDATSEVTLQESEKASLARLLQQQLPEGSAKTAANKLFSASTPANLEALDGLRQRINKMINWKDPSSQFSQRLMNSRETLSSAMDSLVSGPATTPELAEQAQRFMQASGEAVTIADLRAAFKAGGKAATPTWSLNTIRTIMRGTGGAMTTLGALGVPGVGPAGVALKTISSAVGTGQRMATAAGLSVAGLGQFLKSFDEKVVQTIQAGLGTTAESAGAAAEHLVKLPDYDNLAIMLHLMGQHPETAVPRISQVLSDHDVPGPVADLTATSAAKTALLLAQQVQTNPWVGRVVAPVNWPATLKEKAALLDKVNTILDPLTALQTPTAAKMNLLQQVYPTLVNKVQTIVAQEAAARPNLSASGRIWASKITGIAPSPVHAPEVQSVLVQMDQQEAAQKQQIQQQAQKANSRRANSAPQPPQNQTQYQRLLK